jgi:hypothetical protein
VTCTCCVCAGLPLTRGFGGPVWLNGSDQNLDFTTTKLVTWADAGGSLHNVVDGHGPIEMQGQPGWDSFVDGRWLSGSSVTFTKLDGPGLSLGTFLFPSVWTIAYPDNETLSALPKSGSVTASLYGVSLALSYSLTLNQLDASVSNAVYSKFSLSRLRTLEYLRLFWMCPQQQWERLWTSSLRGRLTG